MLLCDCAAGRIQYNIGVAKTDFQDFIFIIIGYFVRFLSNLYIRICNKVREKTL